MKSSPIGLRIFLMGVLAAIFLLIATQAKANGIMQNEQSIYFSFNDAILSPVTKHKLDSIVRDIQARGDVKGVRVVGFADHVGSPSYNEKLSHKRADSVRNYLAAKGIKNATVADIRWFGDSLPATDCRENLSRPALIACLQNDRRVDIEIDYTIRMARAQ